MKKKLFYQKINKLKIKYKKDKKNFLLFINSMILAISLIIGTSYAALTYLSKTANTSKIESGTLALEFKKESNQITLN